MLVKGGSRTLKCCLTKSHVRSKFPDTLCCCVLRADSILTCRIPGSRIPMVEIRHAQDRLFSALGIPALASLYWIKTLHALDLGNGMVLEIVSPNLYHHYDVIKWKHFPHYWSFVWGIHRLPVNSPRKGQWSGALVYSLICAWTNSSANNEDTGDLRCHCAHYDVTVMMNLVMMGDSMVTSLLHLRRNSKKRFFINSLAPG